VQDTYARGKNEHRYIHTLSVLILAENAFIGVAPYKMPFFRRHTFSSWTINE